MTSLLHRMIRDAAEHRSESEAVRCGSDSLDYGELLRRSNGLARTLVDIGVVPGSRVAVLLRKGIDVPVAFHGVFAAGAVLVPIDPGSPVEQVVRILRSSGAVCLVTETKRGDLARRAVAQVPEVTTVVGLDPDPAAHPRCIPWTRVREADSDRGPEVHVIEDDPAYILHTSGSTGIPKLILHTHRSAMSFVDWAVDEYALRPEDRLSNHSSHHTCFATFDFYGAARVGAATVIVPPAELKMPASLTGLVERERISVWYSVPTALVQMSLRGALDRRDFGALRWVLFAGETFPEKHLRDLMQHLPNARFSHVYGSTEVNVCTFHHLPGVDSVSSALPIGKACATSRTLVVDDDLRPVPPGGTGELLVQGATVMSGYWGDAEKSREALVRLQDDSGIERAFFRTGDRVRTLEDGNLTFVARADFQVKVRGHRVELEEVEAALLGLDPVAEAAAVAIPDGEGSSIVQAAVTLRPGAEADEETLLRDLRPVLQAYALPARIETVDALPRTPTGKIDRRKLRDRLERAGR